MKRDEWPAECTRKNREAAEANRAAGLPELTGTQKQVAWAESLRFDVLAELQRKIVEAEQPVLFDADGQAGRLALLQSRKRDLQARTSAYEWIDEATR